MFANVCLTVIEVQMSRRMLLIAGAVENAMIARGSVVCNLAPIKLKREYKISCGNYSKNKRAAIEHTDKILSVTDRRRMAKACQGGKRVWLCHSPSQTVLSSKELTRI